MCILIANNPSKAKLTKDMLSNCLESNPDGFGIMTSKNGVIYQDKVITYDLDTIFALYKSFLDFSDQTIFLHFRIGTSGKIDYTNCHPHRITDNLYAMHNGILDISGNKTKSDTAILCELLGKDKDIENTIFDKTSLSHALISTVSVGSKLTFLRSDNRVLWVNKKLGHEYKGSWFSNYTYEDWSLYSGYKGMNSSYVSDNAYYSTHFWSAEFGCYMPKDTETD